MAERGLGWFGQASERSLELLGSAEELLHSAREAKGRVLAARATAAYLHGELSVVRRDLKEGEWVESCALVRQAVPSRHVRCALASG